MCPVCVAAVEETFHHPLSFLAEQQTGQDRRPGFIG